jgi:hypothetical protein
VPADLLTVDQFRLEGAALTCDAGARLTRLSGRQDLTVEGQLHYDLEKLGPLLRSCLGPGVALEGRDVRPVRLEGTLRGPRGLLAGLRAELALSWASVSALGAEAGPAEVEANLADGWLRLQPVSCTVNHGRLRLEPALRLAPGPAELRLGSRTRLNHAHLTPALCAGALRFGLPVLAGVAELDGQISADLHDGRFPLDDARRGELSATITVHAGRLGPGPLLRELAVLTKGPPVAMLRNESTVTVRLADGRVFHEGLEIVFADLTVRTSGWVGLDGSLQLVAEFGVPPRWLAAVSPGRVPPGQTVRVPITGTLAKPRLDRQALEAAASRLLGDSARDVLRQQVEEHLRHLLPPSR